MTIKVSPLITQLLVFLLRLSKIRELYYSRQQFVVVVVVVVHHWMDVTITLRLCVLGAKEKR